MAATRGKMGPMPQCHNVGERVMLGKMVARGVGRGQLSGTITTDGVILLKISVPSLYTSQQDARWNTSTPGTMRDTLVPTETEHGHGQFVENQYQNTPVTFAPGKHTVVPRTTSSTLSLHIAGVLAI